MPSMLGLTLSLHFQYSFTDRLLPTGQHFILSRGCRQNVDFHQRISTKRLPGSENKNLKEQ
jgi:hypothetical protein